MAMIERVRGPSELRSIAQRAHRLLWAQSVEDYQGGADADQSDGEAARVILRSLSPDEFDAVIKMLRLMVCNS